jgi:hypothetical protein
MSHKAIVNIINFVRGIEPRNTSIDLLLPVEKQIELADKYNLPGTWLLQYDALIDDRFIKLLQTLNPTHEVGIWFEMVQPLVEKAGIKWRGRYPWDWAANVCMSAGYTPGEREKLADVFMAEFKAVFGKYPRSVGAWVMDAHLLGYLYDKYKIKAACICRDQWGTDGYTLWGGYYNQAYYPSRKNSFIPAQHAENQIPVPVFRMLGSDPIYQYNAGIGSNGQSVVTLEPVYACSADTADRGGGGSPKWVQWFFDTTFRTPSLSFGYAQVGQENSFGWPAMRKGLTYQIGLLAERAGAGEVMVRTLSEAGEWFRRKYSLTPASAVVALTDWRGEGRRSIWYNSCNYRTNLFWERDRFCIRDIHLFREEYAERYLHHTCTTPPSKYDTLPAMDGLCWSSNNTSAGIYFARILPDGSVSYIACGTPEVEESGENLIVKWQAEQIGQIKLTCTPEEIRISAAADWGLKMVWSKENPASLVHACPQSLHYRHEGFAYTVECANGRFEPAEEHSILIRPDKDGMVKLLLAQL